MHCTHSMACFGGIEQERINPKPRIHSKRTKKKKKTEKKRGKPETLIP
jgi:hypothetical protein